MGYFSNGTEGAIFEARWCDRCVHSEIGRGGEIGEVTPCPVWMAHLLYAYELCNEKENPGKVILDMLMPQVEFIASDGIEVFDNECAMFVEAGESHG